MQRISKNKKGDISITILVLGVVALCFLTLLSFSINNIGITSSLAGIGLIETVKSIAEEQAFYAETGFKGDYGNSFSKGGTSVIIKDDGTLECTYSPEGKVLARVIYKR